MLIAEITKKKTVVQLYGVNSLLTGNFNSFNFNTAVFRHLLNFSANLTMSSAIFNERNTVNFNLFVEKIYCYDASFLFMNKDL